MALIDLLAIAVFVVDASGRVHYQNTAAVRHIRRGSVLKIKSKRLSAYYPPADDTLQAAIRVVATARRADPVDIALEDGEGGGVIASILREGGQASDPSTHLITVVFSDPSEPRQHFSGSFGEIYKLTPKEIQVNEGLTSGASKADIAMRRKVKPTTISTHVSRLLQKTGTARQSNLVRLYLSSVTPLLSRQEQSEAPDDHLALDGER